MENPATWNRATHVISDALAEADRQGSEGIFGHSPARIIHDALEKEGLLSLKVVEEQDGEQELPGITADDREKAHWCGTGPYASFSEAAKAVIFSLERQLSALREPSKGLDSLSPKEPTELAAILMAARVMDWMQVRLNGGTPCFRLDEDGSFCGRADRWEGHGEPGFHEFISLHDLLKSVAKGSPSEGTGWISVQQELPPRSRILVYFPTESTSVMDGLFDGKDFHVDGYIRTKAVTHWQPLPAPPIAPPEKEVK